MNRNCRYEANHAGLTFAHGFEYSPTKREGKESMRIGQTAPDFEAETTQGGYAFTTGSVTPGRSYFRTRRTSPRCAPPNSAIWLG